MNNGKAGPRKADEPAALELRDIGRHYGHAVAIEQISLRVEPGEIICLVGQSGCGKSTLLRIIAGLEQPTAGQVFLNGREVSGPSRFVEPQDRGVGLIFQDYALFPHLSIAENVMFGLRKIGKRDARREALAALERVHLAHYADRHPHILSGGEQQRVALARALAPRPDVLLMDEPFSNLDRRLRENLREDTIALLRELGTTVILVTHDPQEALSIGDRLVLMRQGRVVQVGTAEEVHDHPACGFAAHFFCDLNELKGICRDGQIETVLGTFSANGAVEEGAESLVCARPQALRRTALDKGIPVRVAGRAFLGEIERLMLAVEGHDGLLKMHVFGRSGLSCGETIRVEADPMGVLVFPADSI